MSTVCRRCDGDGVAHGSDRPFESGPEVPFPGPCPVCKGTGQEEEEKENLVMACPRCGVPVLHSCLHGDDLIRSVEMPVAKAIELMDDLIEDLDFGLETAKEHRQQLLASMMDWET